jgi:hypothetical protein
MNPGRAALIRLGFVREADGSSEDRSRGWRVAGGDGSVLRKLSFVGAMFVLIMEGLLKKLTVDS